MSRYHYFFQGLAKALAPVLIAGALACKSDAADEKRNQPAPQQSTLTRYTPPPNSPLGRKVHPRLYLTTEDLPKLRQRLKTVHRNSFQTFVQVMDANFNEAMEKKEGGSLFIDIKNYAFLYLIDPGQLPEFTFGHTREQYGRQAIALAMLAKSSMRGDKHVSSILQSPEGGYHNLALAVAYDWTFPLLTPEEKRSLAEGLIRLYEIRDKDANPGAYQKLSNQVTGYIHHGSAGALALWGDDLGPDFNAKSDEMLQFFNAVFLERTLTSGDKIFQGPGWSEGASYYLMGLTNISFLAGAAASALGQNLFLNTEFLRYNVLYIFYNILPLKLQGSYYLSRHDTNSLQKADDFGGLAAISAGALAEADPRMAGLAKWLITASGLIRSGEEGTRRGGFSDPRFHYLFFKFIWDSESVTPLPPQALNLPLTYKLGLGQVVMKSSFDPEQSTHLIFWAPQYWYAPHAHLDLSSFTIYKYGSLALDSGNGKNYKDMPRGKSFRQPIFHNILGLYHPEEKSDTGFNFMNFGFREDRTADDWRDESFQPGGNSVVGKIVALESGSDFDFIDYDYSPAYTNAKRSKAGFANRRFVYLRGPENHEFVIVHDLVKSGLEKRFLLHTAFEPAIAGDEITVTNNFDVAHGKMLVKSLLPAQKEILKIGGPGNWFVDADWRPLQSRGPYVDWGAYWAGSYRFEIRSPENEFLTVMQIGDSRTLSAMAPVEKIESTTCSGVLVEGQRLVLFNKQPGMQSSADFEVKAAQPITLIITGVTPDTLLKIKKNGAVYLNVKSSAGGVLNFKDNPGGAAQYEVTQ